MSKTDILLSKICLGNTAVIIMKNNCLFLNVVRVNKIQMQFLKDLSKDGCILTIVKYQSKFRNSFHIDSGRQWARMKEKSFKLNPY